MLLDDLFVLSSRTQTPWRGMVRGSLPEVALGLRRRGHEIGSVLAARKARPSDRERLCFKTLRSESKGNAAATALNYFAYNFIKIHRTLRTSLAMAAGVTDRLWEVQT